MIETVLTSYLKNIQSVLNRGDGGCQVLNKYLKEPHKQYLGRSYPLLPDSNCCHQNDRDTKENRWVYV